jgi:hypothetical protein
MSRMMDLVRTSELSSHLMQAASRGALAVSAGEMIEILVYLASHNHVFGNQARLTLAGWDEKTSVAAASNPETPAEVLAYFIAPQNLRPILLAPLLENPSVSPELLETLAKKCSREVVKAFLNSRRVKMLPKVLEALKRNSNLSSEESTKITSAKEIAQAGEAEREKAHPDEVDGDQGSEDDEHLRTFLQEHAAEIETEANKPFQPIGGVHEEHENVPEPALHAPVTTESPSLREEQPAVPKASAYKKPHPEQSEKRDSSLQKIAKLDVKGRIQLAMKGTKEERSLLVRDGTKLVALAVLESPKVSDGEVEKIAGQRNVLEAVLRAIPLKRRYAKQYMIMRNLVFNPRTPIDVSLGLVKNLLVNDLKNLSGNKEVSETVKKLALRMFKQKLDSAGKR